MLKRSHSGRKFHWTSEDIKFLRRNFHALTNRQLADALGLTLTLVRTKCYELGLKRIEMEYWTKGQIQFLKKNYRSIGDRELAEIFNVKYPKQKGWTHKHIEKKRRYLGLKTTEKQQSLIKQRNVERGCFSINHWKRWIGRVAPEGNVRVWYNKQAERPVVVIKTKSGFRHYAPWLYRKEIGKIKKGHVIRTKDGNPLNIVPENLEMVSRAEHARLNVKARMQYPEELRVAMRLINKINRKLKDYEEQN